MAPKLPILLDRSMEQPRVAWEVLGVSDGVFPGRCPCLVEIQQMWDFLGQTRLYVGKGGLIQKNSLLRL